MNIALRRPGMSREQFFAWANQQAARFEFDGSQPVGMTGGSIRHNLITLAIHRALYSRLSGGPCHALGADAGVATIGDVVRYPDALVTSAKIVGESPLVPDVVVVFEVLSPGSGQIDRIVKVGEYRAVPSILRYLILEHASIGLTSFGRASGSEGWTATTLTAGDTLHLPEIGIDIPVAEFYADVQPPTSEDGTGTT